MNRTQAEPLIAQEWHAWVSENVPKGEKRTSDVADKFFDYLRQKRGWLLDFTGTGDKLHDVRNMLLRRREIV